MVGDLHTPKYRKAKDVSSKYSWRFRSFLEWSEASALLSDRVLKKDVYLPLFFNLGLSSNGSNQQNEHAIRIYRTPIVLYVKDSPATGDYL